MTSQDDFFDSFEYAFSPSFRFSEFFSCVGDDVRDEVYKFFFPPGVGVNDSYSYISFHLPLGRVVNDFNVCGWFL